MGLWVHVPPAHTAGGVAVAAGAALGSAQQASGSSYAVHSSPWLRTGPWLCRVVPGSAPEGHACAAAQVGREELEEGVAPHGGRWGGPGLRARRGVHGLRRHAHLRLGPHAEIARAPQGLQPGAWRLLHELHGAASQVLAVPLGAPAAHPGAHLRCSGGQRGSGPGPWGRRQRAAQAAAYPCRNCRNWRAGALVSLQRGPVHGLTGGVRLCVCATEGRGVHVGAVGGHVVRVWPLQPP
jgi:hypothetical protein